jgi:biofilm PGA synthesis N-glycosyltransferase PgaC
MKSRYTALVFSGVLMIAVLSAMILSVVLTMRAPLYLQNMLVRATVVLLIMFLAVLVMRYLALLWLGYLQHVESGVAEGSAAAEPGSLPPISVIVPAYNEAVVIQAAIRSLLQQDYPRFEVLVVDDGSTDATYAKAAELEGHYRGATVRVVTKINGGKAAALNTGIVLARHPFVLCMDGDSTLSPQALRSMVRHFRDARVAAVAGNVKVVNRVNLWTRLQALEYIEGLNMARRAQGFMRAVNIIPGPIGMFRRDVLVRLGGYDTDTYAEDADLTLKILTAGWRVEYEDKAVAFTEAPQSLDQLIKQRYRWTRGILQALGKRRGALVHPETEVTVWLSLAMMIFEAVVWPFMHVVGSLFFVLVALAFGAGGYLVSWWLLLTLLDVAAALHTVAMEEEELMLVPLAVAYRFFFVLLIDVSKLFATVEEAFDFHMTWGKLERVGRT